MTPGQLIAAGVFVGCTLAAGALIASIAYRAGQHSQIQKRTARERANRRRLAEYILDIRADRRAWIEAFRDVVHQRDEMGREREELLKERARACPHMN